MFSSCSLSGCIPAASHHRWCFGAWLRRLNRKSYRSSWLRIKRASGVFRGGGGFDCGDAILTLLPRDGGMSTRSSTSWRACFQDRLHISISSTVTSPFSPHPAAELLGFSSMGISFLGDTWSLANSTPPTQRKPADKTMLSVYVRSPQTIDENGGWDGGIM